jgi:hypothetical protein
MSTQEQTGYETSPKKSKGSLMMWAFYLMLSLAWMIGLDNAVVWMVHHPTEAVKIAIIKGTLYGVCSATILYAVASRQVERMEYIRTETDLRQTQAILMAVIDQSPGGLVITDLPDQVLHS